MAVSIIFLLILVPLIFGIPILVAVYVYRDANRRGMNAVLWMLVALLTPSLLGLIIYLLVRNNYSDLTCPNCNTPVEESYVVCPNCRTKLRPTCEACGTAVQTSWKVCPHCGTDLPEYDYTVATPVRKKDKTLGKILIAILVIPIAIILLLILLAIPFSYSRSGGYSTGFFPATVESFLESQSEPMQQIYTDWFADVPSSSDHPLVLVYEMKALPDDYEYQYLIYIPGATGYDTFSHSIETKGFFNKTEYWDFDITGDHSNKEQTLFVFEYHGSTQPPQEFLITYNSEEYVLTPAINVDEPFYDISTGPIIEY